MKIYVLKEIINGEDRIKDYYTNKMSAVEKSIDMLDDESYRRDKFRWFERSSCMVFDNPYRGYTKVTHPMTDDDYYLIIEEVEVKE